MWMVLVPDLICSMNVMHSQGWSDSLVDSDQGLGPRVFGSIPRSDKNFVFHNGFGSPPIELSSLWGIRMQVKSLLMMHPGKRSAYDSVRKFLHHSWQLFRAPVLYLHHSWQLSCHEIRRRVVYWVPHLNGHSLSRPRLFNKSEYYQNQNELCALST